MSKSVQLSQRIAGSASTKPYGDLQLVPVIGVKNDADYAGQPVPFDVTVDHPISSLNWGPSTYVVIAGDKSTEFVLRPRQMRAEDRLAAESTALRTARASRSSEFMAWPSARPATERACVTLHFALLLPLPHSHEDFHRQLIELLVRQRRLGQFDPVERGGEQLLCVLGAVRFRQL